MLKNISFKLLFEFNKYDVFGTHFISYSSCHVSKAVSVALFIQTPTLTLIQTDLKFPYTNITFLVMLVLLLQ